MTYDIDGAIRRIPHHPKPGILFYDLMPLFVTSIADWARPRDIDMVLGAEARGFILGAAIAREINAGFACARKPGKLPYETISREYDLEYGTDVLELHRDAITPGQRVLVHDDLLATGGTAAAKCALVEELGGVVAGLAFVVELTFLPGRAKLGGYDVLSLVQYDSEDVDPA